MTARYNIFKAPKPAQSEYGDQMSVMPSLCREDLAINSPKLPGEGKQANLGVENCPNTVRGHKV